MKVKLMYAFIVVLGLTSIFLLYQKNDTNDVQFDGLSSEVVLLSETVVLDEVPNEEVESLDLKNDIEQQILILKENLETLKTLKNGFNEDYSNISQRDKIFIRLSLKELSTYRLLYQETIGSIKTILAPYEGQYDMLTEDEIKLIGTEIITIQNYRLVLIEKANEEILTLIDILNTY